jgi:hypothetical protein
MAAKAKKGERLARSAEHRKQPGMKAGRGAAKLMQLTAKGERLPRSAERGKQPAMKAGRGAAKHMQLTAGDFERTVIYRGIKIEPTMAAGKRSSLARAIRDDLRTKSEQSRGKSG